MTRADAAGTLEKIAAVYRVLGHETRLRLLALLLEGECSVGEIETRTGIGQPGLSQQLAILRKAGLVMTRREAKQVFYRIAPAGLKAAAALIERLQGGGAATPPKEPGRKPKPAGGSAAMFAKILSPA